MSTAPSLLAPGSRHGIVVRKPGLDFDTDIPRHWLGGSAFETHLFNGLNLVFPDGERAFVRAVRDHLDQIEDEELREQVKGFFGQEGAHAREHERYFAILEAQGYDLSTFLRRLRRFSAVLNRWIPASVRLAFTAGAEHYTATFGAMALEDDFIDQAHPTLRKLILWHATEEIEHKAVAYDVLQATHPSYLLRLLGFALATLLLFSWSAAGTRMLLRQDRRAGRLDRDRLRRERRILAEREHARGHRRMKAVMAYLRPGFHPNQTDELPLAHRRLAELGIEPAAAR